MARRRALTEAELAFEAENLTDFDASDFSDDSIADPTFSQNQSSSSSEDEGDEEVKSSDVENEDEAAEVVPLADILPERRWEPVAGDRKTFPFSAVQTGVPADLIQKLHGASPIVYFVHFIDDDVISVLVEETNRYAAQKNATGAGTPRLNKWTNTDPAEMRKFLGIVIWMGLMHLPKLRDYWCTKRIYENGIRKVMSRNRFELLLMMFHLSNNEELINPEDRLHKISKFLNMLEKNFKESYYPEEEVCIDESNVPFRGRIYFRQYLPNKRYKYGIKVFKLCVNGGYTWSFKVYTGKERVQEISVSEKIVKELMNGLLDTGRTLYTDNWYTSVSLSENLIQWQTHLVGTLRSNRKNNPPDVVKAKLRRGEVVAQQNQNKTVVCKWKDKRDVLMLSTKHDDSMVTVHRRGQEVHKPTMVVEYNKGKAFVDHSDQMAAYAPYVRRTVKWYKRLVFHFITSTAMVNALHLYNKVNNKRMGITEFKEAIVEALVYQDDNPRVSRPSSSKPRHFLKEYEGQKRVTRKRCNPCYKTMSQRRDPAYARKNAKKINTYCDSCELPMCLECFQKHLETVSLE